VTLSETQRLRERLRLKVKDRSGVRQVTSKRILLAEDDPAFRYLLASALRRDGHHVVAVSTGVDLVDALHDALDPELSKVPFDLVLSDLRMPGWPGIEGLARIAGDPSLPPLILFTAFGDGQTHQRALELGALTLLDKPFDIDDLRDLIVDVLT
jgi:CheY-like chemotaxis protein